MPGHSKGEFTSFNLFLCLVTHFFLRIGTITHLLPVNQSISQFFNPIREKATVHIHIKNLNLIIWCGKLHFWINFIKGSTPKIRQNIYHERRND